ncbi:hypothetical protein ACS0TY_014401 [Phlomoides rotata]
MSLIFTQPLSYVYKLEQSDCICRYLIKKHAIQNEKNNETIEQLDALDTLKAIQSCRVGGHYSLRSKVTHQLNKLHFLINYNDETGKDHIQMNSNYFNRLCFLLQNLGGLISTRNVSISEQVAIFLIVLSHHTKNRVVKHNFGHSGYTISKHFNSVLNTLLRLHRVLLTTHHFLGALDVNIMDNNSNMQTAGRGRKKYVTNSRRVWTYMEETELVCALKEIVNSLATKFPGTDLKGGPHINSKIHVWKKQYACLKEVLGVSGMGLNNTTFHIDALPEVWAAHMKVIINVDPTSRGLKKKIFSFYSDWGEIFGNDRAAGADSQAYVDAEKDVINQT